LIEYIEFFALFWRLSDSEPIGFVSAIEIAGSLEPEWSVIGYFAELIKKLPSMHKILFPLIGDIIIFAFELPVDNLGVPQFWIRLLA
jgi:hypothetical protein